MDANIQPAGRPRRQPPEEASRTLAPGLRDWPEAVTFDFYGTIVNNRPEARKRFGQILRWNRAGNVDSAAFHARWVRVVSDLQLGPFQLYRDICELALDRVFAEYGIEGRARDIEHYFEGFASFELWPETETVLGELARRYPLGLVTNCDDDLFALTPKPSAPIRFHFTSEAARGYKADGTLFRYVLREAGLSQPGALLHAGQSQRTDLVGAKPLGIVCAWINRHSLERDADVPEPDFVFPDLSPLGQVVGSSPASVGEAPGPPA